MSIEYFGKYTTLRRGPSPPIRYQKSARHAISAATPSRLQTTGSPTSTLEGILDKPARVLRPFLRHQQPHRVGCSSPEHPPPPRALYALLSTRGIGPEAMQDAASELPRTSIPRTSVNKVASFPQ